MSPDRRDADLRAVESFFRRSGVPHLVEDRREAAPGLGWLRVPGAAFELALRGARGTALVAIRALPPLLAVLLFLSLASETWRAFGRLEGWRYAWVLIGFGVLAAVILLVGLRGERRALESPAAESLEDDARATPALALVEAGVRPETHELGSRVRTNVAVALLVSLGVRVFVVGLAVCAAFLLFGMLIVDRALAAEWVGADPHVLVSLRLGGREVVFTEALVRVATTMGAFAALYFAAVALGDDRNRREFVDDELERLRRVMAAWAYYRGALTMPSDTYQSTVRRSDSSSGV